MKKILNTYFWKMSAVSMALLASAFFVSQYNHYTDLRDGYFNMAQRISQGLSSQFSFFYHNVQNIAFNRSLRRLSSSESREYFDMMVALYPNYDMIVLTDKDGKFLASNTVGSEGEALKTRFLKKKEVFDPSKSSTPVEDLNKGFIGTATKDFHENEIVSEVYGRKKIVMSFTAPVTNYKGDTVGYAISFINHNWVGKQLQSLSEEFGASTRGDFDVYLLNQQKSSLASNVRKGFSPLAKLPFEVETANFSKHTKDGNIIESISSFFKFGKHPLFLISKFNHQNFLSEMGWSLIVRMDKNKALSTIFNSLAWFWGAFLLFLIIAKALKFKAIDGLEKAWKVHDKERELSFEEALGKAQAGELAAQIAHRLEKVKKMARITLPEGRGDIIALDQIAKDLDRETKAKNIKEEGFKLIEDFEFSKNNFGRAINKRALADHEQKRIESSIDWNMGQAKERLRELRVLSLNLELGSSGAGQKPRELDSIAEKSMIYFDEAKKASESVSKLRDKACKELSDSWKTREEFLNSKSGDIKHAYMKAWERAEELAHELDEFKKMASTWRDDFSKLSRERANATDEVNKLVGEIEDLQNYLINKKEEEIKKAA